MLLTKSQVALVQHSALTHYPDSVLKSHSSESNFNGANTKLSIKEALKQLFTDAGFGTSAPDASNWNPIGKIVRRGDTVLLKPNWVMHRNASGQGLDCLITNAALVSAMLELVLNCSPRKVVVGDAPVQGCDLDRLFQDAGYNLVKEHYERLGAPVEWVDFRRTTLDRSKAVWERHANLRPEEKYTLFDMGRDSLLEPISGGADRFRVTVYNPDLMLQRHAPEKHQYLVTREVLQADVVFNLPKLKTHAKAGITAALKNVVGINGNKEFLPHHRLGGKDRGGDCYAGRSRLKLIGEHLLDSANRHAGAANLAFRQASRASFKLARILGQDKNTEGSWHGNDTIWRTCLDLNRILLYGAEDGTLTNLPRRRIVTVTDAVVCGEGEGPLAPTPIPLGILTCALNPVAADYVHSHIMGFNWRAIPLIREAFGRFNYPLTDFAPEDIEMLWNGRQIQQPWPKSNTAPFRAPLGWRGHCERDLHL